MQKLWAEEAWDEYLWWQSQDRRTLRKINALIKEVERDPRAKPVGKGELLRGRLGSYRSVRIDKVNRLTYMIDGDVMRILSCRGHYDDK